MKVLILGVNGFIGHHLTNRILDTTEWSVYGLDLDDNRLSGPLGNPRFHFMKGNISANKEWIKYHIKHCDIIVPLAAIALPKLYMEDPIMVYNLDFEINIDIIKQCIKYQKRVVFPSSSEVYGACSESEFKEEESFLVVGPIQNERWIYSCCKQLLERIIYAYGIRSHLDFTIFRPFNWIGPGLDSQETSKLGRSRVVTQFISALLMKQPLLVVNGGFQRRCFTYVDDGISALMKILENSDNRCKNQIINIGNPNNDCAINELALLMRKIFMQHPKHCGDEIFSEIIPMSSDNFYGKGYQDILARKPNIEKAQNLLGWEPQICLEESLRMSIDSFIHEFRT